MSLPELTCPACGVATSLEALLGHQGARDALLALATLHPSNTRVSMVSLRYVGLFSPAKQKMRLDRMAAVLNELRELISAGKVEWKGVTHPAPLEYWLNAMEQMLGRGDELSRPLANHNYLRAMVAGAIEKAARDAESTRENRLTGRTPTGGLPPPPPPPTQVAPRKNAEPIARPPMEHLRAALGQLNPGRKPGEKDEGNERSE